MARSLALVTASLWVTHAPFSLATSPGDVTTLPDQDRTEYSSLTKGFDDVLPPTLIDQVLKECRRVHDLGDFYNTGDLMHGKKSTNWLPLSSTSPTVSGSRGWNLLSHFYLGFVFILTSVNPSTLYRLYPPTIMQPPRNFIEYAVQQFYELAIPEQVRTPRLVPKKDHT